MTLKEGEEAPEELVLPTVSGNVIGRPVFLDTVPVADAYPRAPTSPRPVGAATADLHPTWDSAGDLYLSLAEYRRIVVVALSFEYIACFWALSILFLSVDPVLQSSTILKSPLLLQGALSRRWSRVL